MKTNELKHFGVKGMKWGVRRYQNKDGSLTPAGQKRHERNDKIRNKEADRYKRMADGEKRASKRETDFAKRLKSEGSSGKTMKDMYGFTDDKTAMNVYGQNMKSLWKDTINEAQSRASISRDRVEAYLNANKALLDMDVSTVKKRDIYKLGTSVVNRTFNEQNNRD